jgi:hydroxymethylpyrimidine/phosphomethylpyrimidine kinase
MRVALTIAGSDSGGGAGIQADLKTFHQFGVFGTSAVVAVTAQNTTGVQHVHALPLDIVHAQIRSVATDLPPAAIKTGMLATADLVETVAGAVAEFRLYPLVVDPVMVATSGHRLLDPAAVSAVQTRLIPLALIVTPNIVEAATLTGRSIVSPADMTAAGVELVGMGARAALVKGGHLDAGDATDVLVTAEGTRTFTHPRLPGTNTHGTGCTLSAALTAGLALGQDLEHAVGHALDFVHAAIAHAPDLGRGNGPLNHFVPIDA